MRRTAEQLLAFRTLVLSGIPRSTRKPRGITAIAIAAGVIDSADGWTRVLRRQVNDAISSLLADEKIEVVGRGKATKYRRAAKRETSHP
jgi:hypothetical protein